MTLEIGYNGKLQGELSIPGDKSISHRAIIFSSITKGISKITGFLESNDCLNTIKAFQNMGVKINKVSPGIYNVKGVGLTGLNEPTKIIDCGNSGTTMRLLTGLLAGQEFYSVLTGDSSLRKRPMERVIVPLTKMGAKIWSRQHKLAPLSIQGQTLNGIKYKMPIASAQLKSCILLAGLYTDQDIILYEPAISRDHTENFFKYFNFNLIKQNNKIILSGNRKNNIKNKDIRIPGDISAASFFIAAALMIKNSDIVLKNVGINYTRSGFIDIINKMGGKIELINKKEYGLEPVADIRVKHSKLQGTNVKGEIIPRTIDEIPLIAVLASQAKGQTVIRDAEELRVKETDRIKAIVKELQKLGVDIIELKDGMKINGPTSFKNNLILDSFGDHRIAMSLAIASLKSKGRNIIKNTECINNSFPDFRDKVDELIS